jgi:hypothetical protein
LDLSHAGHSRQKCAGVNVPERCAKVFSTTRSAVQHFCITGVAAGKNYPYPDAEAPGYQAIEHATLPTGRE